LEATAGCLSAVMTTSRQNIAAVQAGVTDAVTTPEETQEVVNQVPVLTPMEVDLESLAGMMTDMVTGDTTTTEGEVTTRATMEATTPAGEIATETEIAQDLTSVAIRMDHTDAPDPATTIRI